MTTPDDATPDVRFTAPGAGCGGSPVTPSLAPGSSWTVCVRQQVRLPYADRGVFAHVVPATITVQGGYVVDVDRYRSGS